MKFQTCRKYAVHLGTFASLSAMTSANPADALRAWTIEDTISYSKISQGEPSPDKHYLPVVTTHGCLKANQLESRLWLLDIADANSFIQSGVTKIAGSPRLLVTMAVEPNGAWKNDHVISNLRWSTEGKKVFFLARAGRNSERRLFAVDVASGQSTQLSCDGQDVTGFDATTDVCVYLASKLPDIEDEFQSGGSKLPEIVIGTGKPILDLLYPNRRKYSSELGPQELWLVKNLQAASMANSRSKIPFAVTADPPILSLSPDGKDVVVAQQVDSIPAYWERYKPFKKNLFKNFVAGRFEQTNQQNRRAPESYALIDLASGQTRSLIDAPLGISAGYEDCEFIRWSKDGHKVLLSGVFFPFEKITNYSDNEQPNANKQDSAERLHIQQDPKSVTSPNLRSEHLRPCVVVVDIISKRLQFVSERPPTEIGYDLTVADWVNDGKVIVVQYAKGKREFYKLTDGNWQSVDERSLNALIPKDKRTSLDQIEFFLQESVNQPTVLMIKNRITSKQKIFFDPNPQLAEIEMGNVSLYKWHSESGRELSAALIKPFDYQPGKRYPLVIQGYGFDPDSFLADSYFNSAYPGRALASRGMVVFQPKDVRPGRSMMPEGIDDACESYLSSIVQLTKDGLIDPTRVGIIGFSHSGSYILHALTRQPNSYRAAVLAEVTTNSFTEYLNSVDWGTPAFRKEIAFMERGEPFGSGLAQWVRNSPAFNTEKINAAVLCQSYSPKSLVWSWDIYPALRAQGKAVELLYMRNGQHELLKPKQRFVSQEATLDWFDFWLNDHEDPDPTKTEQYSRWRQMQSCKE